MHILLIPSWYHTPANPIRGSFFREQGLALQRAGHRVGLLVPPSKQRTWNGLAEARRYWRRAADDLDVVDDEGMMTYRIPWWGWAGALSPRRRVTLALAAFDSYCREQARPDVIHAHSILYGGFIGAHIRRARGVPVVITENSSTFVRRLIFPDQGLHTAWTLRNSDLTFAVNPIQAEALRRYAPECTVDVIPNSVNTDMFRPADQPPAASPFQVAAIGNLIPLKGMDVLLRAFAQAYRGGDARLEIIGDGAERDSLESLIDTRGLRAQAVLTGRIPREAVRDAIQRSHVIVSASYHEMLPFNLIEAMACGKPIIATASEGGQALVNAVNGLLVPPGDVEALAGALHQMRATYDRYDPAAIRAHCLAHYSDGALVQRLEAIYESLLAAGRKSAGS